MTVSPDPSDQADLVTITADIVSAYVSNSCVRQVLQNGVALR
ncbi:hypothetical protein [Mesorhizobium sp. M0644]